MFYMRVGFESLVYTVSDENVDNSMCSLHVSAGKTLVSSNVRHYKASLHQGE